MARGIALENTATRTFAALILSLGLIAGLVSTSTPAAAAVYEITWDDNGATTASSGRQTSYDTAAPGVWAVPTTPPVRTGYTFRTWTTSASGGTVWSFGAKPTGPITYYAKWDAGAITWDHQGGVQTPGIPGTGFNFVGWPVATLRGVTRDGYTFAGWFDSISGGTQVTANSYIPSSASGGVTFYARWDLTVTYNSQGGTEISNGATTTGGSIESSPGTPTRDGYTFSGWFPDPVDEGNLIEFPYEHQRNENFSIYAQWAVEASNEPVNFEPVNFTVIWDNNEGDESYIGGEEFYLSGSPITFPTTDPQKIGYTFLGWCTDQKLPGETCDSVFVTNRSYTPAAPFGDFVFYAHWAVGASNEPVNFNVTWDNNEADGENSGGEEFYLSGSPITFPTTDPQKIGHTFLGWCTDQKLPGATCNSVFVTNRSYTPAAPFGDFTFFAHWAVDESNEPVDLTVTYNSQGGTEISNGATTTGGSIESSPGTPTRDGYTFSGWFAAATGGSAITFPYTHAQTTNFTLFARWAAPSSSDASLSGLELRNSQDSLVSFSPVFSAGVKNYTANVSNGSAGIRITPTRNQADASITINGQPSFDPIFSINSRWIPNLNIGSNSLIVVVTAQDGTTTSTYTVTVTRAAEMSNPDNTITWDNQGATIASSGGSTAYTNGSSVATIPTTAPQKTGHTFVGWFTGSTTGSQVTNGSFTPSSPYGNVTFYAHWTLNRLSSVGTWAWTNQSSAGVRKWHALATSADGSKLFSGVDDGGSLYRSTDFGINWNVIAGTSGKNWFSIASNIDGTKVAAVDRGGDIWTSTDSGLTWIQRSVGAARNWESIASSSDGLKLVAVASNGDSNGFIYTSSDSGATWSNVQSPPGNNKFTGVASSNDGIHLAATTWANGMYTSSDSGQTWTARTLPVPNAGSVTHLQAIASSGDGSRLVTGSRLTGSINGGVIFTSADYGVSWKAYAQNSYDYINFASNGDGSRLATAIYGQSGVSTSSDFGATWTYQSIGVEGEIPLASNVDGSLLFVGAYGGNLWTGKVPNARVAAVLPTSTSANLSRSANTPAVALSFSASSAAAPAMTVTPITNPTAEVSTPFSVAQASIFDISVVNVSGPVTICVDGGPDVRLWHYTDGAWVDVTTSQTATQTCGVTSSFSPFATGPVARASLVATATNADVDAAQREAEKQSARADITNKLQSAADLTVESFVKAEIPGITAGNIAAVQAEILALPEESRTDVKEVLKVARKYEVVGIIASTKVKTLTANSFVEIGLIPATSKNKVALVLAVRKLPASARDTYAEIKAAIDAETAKIKARSDRMAAIAARKKARLAKK